MTLNNFKNLIEDHSLNQRQLAQNTNIPYTTINGWFTKNQSPRIEHLITLANYFNCTVDYIVDKEKDAVLLTDTTAMFKDNKTEEDIEMQKIWQELNYKNRCVLIGRALGLLDKQIKGEN